MAGSTQEKETVRRISAGGAVFRKSSNKDNSCSWLLINPKSTDRWQLPKGGVEAGESQAEAAAREVGEEGGVEVKVLDKLGSQQYFYHFQGKKVFQTVIFFLMEYRGDMDGGYDKKEIEKVEFLPFEQACERLSFVNDKEILQKAKKIFEGGIQESLI